MVYLVLGEDYEWHVAHAPNISNVIVLKPSTAAVDFCILSHANHSIMSTGTFGLMSSLLAGGITLFQKIQIRPGSRLDAVYNSTDFITDG